jgi:superfamily II DNA or RNA helicase
MTAEQKKEQIHKEVLELLKGVDRAGIGLTMGMGKTYLGLKHMLKNLKPNCKFLVAAPTNVILESWKSEAEKFNLVDVLQYVDFTTYSSLSKQDFDYDIVYLDEYQHVTESHNEWLSNHCGKIIALSGTPPEGGIKLALSNIYYPLIYTFKTDDAVQEGMLNNYKIYVHRLNLDYRPNITKKRKDGRIWKSSEAKEYEYISNLIQDETNSKSLQMLRIRRLTLLKSFESKVEYCKKLLKLRKRKVIVFANTKDQADRLSKYSYHSGNKNSERNLKLFSKGEIDVLSAVLQISAGVNIPGLESAIILHAYSNNNKLSQRLGRCLRLDVSQTATIHVLCYKNTVDELWVKEALKEYDQSKITFVNDLFK